MSQAWLLPSAHQQLSQLVECYWFVSRQPAQRYPKLNPDPNAHLVLAPVSQPYRYDSGVSVAEGTGCHWLLPHDRTLTMDHRQTQQMLGIKLRLGGLYGIPIHSRSSPLLAQQQVSQQQVVKQQAEAKPAPRLRDEVIALVPTQLPGGSWDTEIVEAVLQLAQTNPQQCAERLDHLLLPWLQQRQSDKHSQLVDAVRPHLDTLRVAQLSEQLPYSARTIERSFSRVTGFTIKQCQSMQRLDALLIHLSQLQSEVIDWADVAQQFGFSDQPHLIRYLKQRLGNTPGEYAKSRDFAIDYYGDFDLL